MSMELPVNASQAESQKKSVEIYGTFWLDRSEFTLPVTSVQEVVNYPKSISIVPLSPPFLQGVFNLRGVIIPLVCMRKLLKFTESSDLGSSKVAIIDFEGAKLGLIFDSTGEILHVQPEQTEGFSYAGTTTMGPVCGALKLDQGNRIIQVLYPPALFRIENIPQVLGDAQKTSQKSNFSRGARTQVISFLAGHSRLALDIQTIHEIIRVPELQNAMVQSENTLGQLVLRGEVISVIDFVRLLGFRDGEARNLTEERIIVLRVEQSFVGLLIDAVENIVSFYPDEVLPIPLFNKKSSELFDGMISRDGSQDLVLLRAEGVRRNAEIQALARGNSHIHGLTNNSKVEAKRKSNVREVCIAFQLERAFALPIQQIQEIIQGADQLIQPPGLPAAFKGVLNLRGQAITVVDLRRLYGLAPLQDPTHAKILIIESQGARYGLLVDSVESIVSYYQDQKLTFPKALLREQRDSFHDEVREIVEVTMGAPDSKKCLMVLELDRLVERMTKLITGRDEPSAFESEKTGS